MFRAAAPTYHRCPVCALGYRRAHLFAHMELMHPVRSLSLWDRFVTWVRATFAH